MSTDATTAFTREALFTQRLNAALDGLQDDVDRWRESLPAGTAIVHHISQFGALVDKAYTCLIQAYQTLNAGRSDDQERLFESLVIGALTSQWMALQQAASQRLASSPYAAALAQFDKEATRDYERLRQALTESARAHVSQSPPLVYLGRVAQLTLFHNAPSLLSVPFGAMAKVEKSRRFQDDRVALAIPHEVSHAVLESVPDWQCELRRKVVDALARQESTGGQVVNPQHLALWHMMMDWLSEIVADMAGTALSGVAFAQSGLWITVSSDDTVGVTDRTHPVALLRPYIHLATLKHLAQHVTTFGEAHAAEISGFENNLQTVVGERLKRRFESTPKLMVVSLQQVKDELDKVVNQVLSTSLEALAGQSFGQVLLECATQDAPSGDRLTPLPEWGAVADTECEQFILDLPSAMRPDLATPEVFPLNVCCLLHLWFCCVPGA